MTDINITYSLCLFIYYIHFQNHTVMGKVKKPSSSYNTKDKDNKRDKRSFWEKFSDGLSDWWEAAKEAYVENNDIKYNGGGFGGV